MTLRVIASVAGLLLALGLAESTARADLIVLKNGGQIHGELQREKGTTRTTGGPLTIRTLSGSVIVVAPSEVESVTKRRLIVEEFELRWRKTPDTIEAQWELAEWCREKLLSRERERPLERILELDPDHILAHRALGHVQVDGTWTTREEMMLARGYVKYKGRYVLPQELELIKDDERETEAEKGWYKKVKMWQGWLEGDHPGRQAEALKNLREITDPQAVPALYRTFNDSPQEAMRLLYIEILTQIKHDKALGPLVSQSMMDNSERIRSASIDGVRAVGAAKALPVYLRALKHDLNIIVNRAASALGQIGDEHIVPQLIEALVTTHKYRVMVPDQNTIGIRTDGTMAPQGVVPLPPDIAVMLLTGQLPYGVQVNEVPPPGQELRKKPAIIQKHETNPSVLTALTRLTGQNLGYNENAWRAWLNASKNGKTKGLAQP